MNIKETTESIVTQFEKQGIKVKADEIEKQFEQLVTKFKIP